MFHAARSPIPAVQDLKHKSQCVWTHTSVQAGAKLPLHRIPGHRLGTWRHWPLTSAPDAVDESDGAEASESSSDGGEEDGEDEDVDVDGDLDGLRRQNGGAARPSDSKEDEVHSLCH